MNLEFRSVSFGYRRKGLLGSSPAPVLRDFSWRVPSGRTVILGPNGAGKTTLLALGATALRPSSGQVRLGDLDSTDRRHVKQFRRAVGWMPQQTRAIPGLTAREQVAYAGWLKGLPHPVAWRDAGAALQRVDLLENANRLTTQLSGGQQRRVALAQLLVHRAEVLLLDEPTVGLDPGQRGRFRDTLRLVSEHGPVVVSTHQVDDLTELFDTVVVINSGSIVFEGSVAAFMDHAPSGCAQRAETAYGHFIAGER